MKFSLVFAVFLALVAAFVSASDIACTQQYDPVCGQDGHTYGNQCELDRAGVKKASDGECPK